MFFSAIKEINRLWKEINSLLSKGMSNIYLKITIDKKWHTQNFDFLSLKSSSLGSVWRVPTQADIIEFSNFLLQLHNQSSESKTVCGFPIIFILREIMTFYKCQRADAFYWTKI